MKKNGFTLVELLAVTVVLGFIIIIAVPKITKTLNNSKNETLELSAKSIAKSAEEAYLEKETYGLEEEITCESISNINSEDYLYCNISFNEKGEAKVTIIGEGQYKGKYICNGTKMVAEASDKECSGGIPTDILEQLHKFYYYSSMVKAVNDVNSSEIGKNEDSTKEDAVAGIYTYNDESYVVLLKDSIEEERLKPSVDMTINLGGNTLSSYDTAVINILGGNLTIEGTIPGSGIIQEKEDANAVCVQIPGSNTSGGILKVNGGSYFAISNKEKAIAIAFNLSGNMNVTMSDCNIKAYANLFRENNTITSYSTGIKNYDILSVNNCSIVGTHSAVQNSGTMYVNGGTYSGFERGFHLNGNVTYIKNATISEVEMPDGYTTNVTSENIAIEVGGSSNADNMKVYVDSCHIYSGESQILMRGIYGEENNSLYISNSKLYSLNSNIINIDIGSNTHKFYIGKGNNFTKDNTNLPESVVETDEVYVKNEE